MSERAPRRDVFLQEVIEDVSADLREAKIKASVTGRPKHYYSVYQKMIARNVGFDDIYDLVGIRVLVDSVRDCYAALGTVHARWNPVPGPVQGLHRDAEVQHVPVAAHDGHRPRGQAGRAADPHLGHAPARRVRRRRALEVQGRDRLGGGGGRSSDMAWLRQLVDWQRETADPAEFLDSLRFDLGAAEVYVFTPRGEVIALPQGATPVDFAYAIHTEVGHRTIGARVNGRLVALESTLDNGDTVEIFTSKAQDAGPSRDWLGFVKSARARNKIRHWFSKERREAAAEARQGRRSPGRCASRACRCSGWPPRTRCSVIAQDLHYTDLSGLYAAVGEGHVSAQSVVGKLVRSVGRDGRRAGGPGRDHRSRQAPRQPPHRRATPASWSRARPTCGPGCPSAAPRCPATRSPGFVTRGHGVSVHRVDCVNLAHLLQSQARAAWSRVRWSPREGSLFLVAIQVEALDRTGLLSDVTRVLSDQHVNILSASVTTTRDRVAFSRFTFEMGDPKHLGHVLRAVRSIDGVYDVYRVTS